MMLFSLALCTFLIVSHNKYPASLYTDNTTYSYEIGFGNMLMWL